MPILTTDLAYLGSTSNLGGAITANIIPDATLHNLFDVVGSAGSENGETNYRCIYLKNNHGSITLQDAAAYLSVNTPSVTTEMEIGFGTATIGGVEQSIPDETTAPIGVVFTALIGDANSVALGSIPPGSHKAIWLKRVIDAGTVATPSEGATIIVTGDSV